MLKALYQAHAEPAAALALQARCEAQVVSWRWATASIRAMLRTAEPR